MTEHQIAITSVHSYNGPYFHLHMKNPFIDIVDKTREETRIYVMLGMVHDFLGLMDHLQNMGLLNTGDYFVVGITWDSFSSDKPKEVLQGIFDESVANETVLAFRHFFGVMHTPPMDPNYAEFKNIVDGYLSKPPFSVPNVYEDLGNGNVSRNIPPEAAYLYDAVLLYAKVVHDVIETGGDPRDGRAIIQRIRGTTYKSSFGFLSYIDKNGDAHGNYSVIVSKYREDTGWGMFPVGTFRLQPDGDALPTFHFEKGESFNWINGAPPLAEPVCGFHREKCQVPKTYTFEIAGGVAGGIVFIICIIGYIFYSNWRYEQELAGLLWKIDLYKDIVLTTDPYYNNGTQNNNSNQNCKSSLHKSTSQSSLISISDIDMRQLFTHVGIYKGTVVATRKVNKTHIELTRSVKKELKTVSDDTSVEPVRELRHDNVNPFIGACVEPPNIYIITGYCSKGSLQDILENEDILLDFMFIASLVFDIIKTDFHIPREAILENNQTTLFNVSFGGFELMRTDRGGQTVVILRFDVVRLGFDVVRLGFDVVRFGFDVVRLGFDVMRLECHLVRLGSDVVRLGFDVVTLGFDVVRLWFDVVRLGLDIVSHEFDVVRPV
ncbi:Guanylate cyclase 32E [Bulinus truncatus]|nr:Guanylate cyclase 32E [Bulinus truncatus]